MKLVHRKIDQIATRLREYEKDGKARYYRISYVSPEYKEPQIVGGDRVSGEQNFRDRIYKVLDDFKPTKIIVEEFNQKSRNMKEAASTIEIDVEQEANPYFSHAQAPTGNKESDKKESKKEDGKTGLSASEVQAMLDKNRVDMQSDFEARLKLEREKDHKDRIEAENEQLKSDVKELEILNEGLGKKNDELVAEVERLGKYVPENLKIGNVSVTKTLGSILGTATETLLKNVVTKKPEKLRGLLGDVAFEQLAGFMEDEPEEQSLEGFHAEEVIDPLEPMEQLSPEEEEKNKITGAIHQLNQSANREELGKLQILYAYLLSDDERIDPDKLNKLVRMVAKAHTNEKRQCKDSPQYEGAGQGYNKGEEQLET